MTAHSSTFASAQHARNDQLLSQARYLGREVTSEVLPLQLDIAAVESLTDDQAATLQAVEIDAARIAIQSLASLATIGELDHLGGGLDLIPALNLSLAVSDYRKIEYTIENAHCSIGYYGLLAAHGFVDRKDVIQGFRRGLDIAGHVSWLPGGTQLNGGRLGVMIPVAVGQALGKRGMLGDGCWVITHCGDAGWISGQALNGFNAADLHGAPCTFVMHRNGIQLSGSNRQIMDKDPRPIIASLGIEILEIETVNDVQALYAAYREAYALAGKGRPSMIYPTGRTGVALSQFAADHGIEQETQAFAARHGVPFDTPVWIPGSLMSYRDIEPMLECIFLVNQLPGGAGHHDGHMKGRQEEEVLGNPMMSFSDRHQAVLEALRRAPVRTVTTLARPEPGSENLPLDDPDLKDVALPEPGKAVSPRAGVQAGYALVAKKYPRQTFIVSCDLDPSTKLDKAKALVDDQHRFELSIEEQVATMVADGLAMATHEPQLNVFSTFSAFFEGIAREGLELWRYQRNLNGVNEGLNVTLHMSHVGACTGRDHFSGWSLDWVTLALGYLPYLHRFYAPADARAAFLAVKDLAAHYGGHLIGIPRDNLPVLAGADGSPLWNPGDAWEAVTPYRTHEGAKKAILALGAPAYLAGEAAEELTAAGDPTDALVVNGLPLPGGQIGRWAEQYPGGLVTIEDGLIGCDRSGLRGFAGLVAGNLHGTGVPFGAVGIVDPRIAPSEGHLEVWEHFGITKAALVEAVRGL